LSTPVIEPDAVSLQEVGVVLLEVEDESSSLEHEINTKGIINKVNENIFNILFSLSKFILNLQTIVLILEYCRPTYAKHSLLLFNEQIIFNFLSRPLLLIQILYEIEIVYYK
tara:strand:- start:21 stop:356 length:336 start_codon:yes stop_codon:yes gene_type:complete